MSIDTIVRKIIELGLDLGTKDAVKATLEALDADTSLLDEVYIGIKNELNRKAFAKVPVSERALFISHCLRHSKLCKAEMTEMGYICKRCGSCVICQILEEAERLGYKAYIVPGGSMVFDIVKKTQPKACFGVACYPELEEAIGKCARMGIPTRAVPLTKAGCIDTKVDVERVLKALNI
jgi:hypothetical protein